jgi:hypothetical protein
MRTTLRWELNKNCAALLAELKRSRASHEVKIRTE